MLTRRGIIVSVLLLACVVGAIGSFLVDATGGEVVLGCDFDGDGVCNSADANRLRSHLGRNKALCNWTLLDERADHDHDDQITQADIDYWSNPRNFLIQKGS